MSRDTRSALALSAVLLIAALVVPAAAAAADGPETTDSLAENGSALVVELEPDGDARLTLVLTYDLADGDDEAAFEALRDRPENVTARFDDRVSGIADRTAAETEREMAVSDVRADIESADGTGTVRLSASWTNLAAVEGDRLVVSEPFASEFRPDRQFVLVAPDGYALADTTVPADATTPAGGADSATAAWTAGTDLSGFTATIAPSDASGSVTDGSLPTPLAPALAVVAVGLLAYAGWRRT